LGFYQSRHWIDGICKTYGLKSYTVFAGINSLVVIEIKSRLFGHRLISLPFCEYGIDTVSTLSEGVLENLRTLKEITKAEYFEIRSPQKHEALHVNAEYSTFTVSGETLDQVWSKVDRKLRQQIKEASKLFIMRENNIDEFYSFYLQNQTRRGSPVHSQEFFEKCGLEIYLAYLRPKPSQLASAILIGSDGPEINWWGNVNDPKLRSLNGTSWLLWEIIKRKFQPGFNFDLGRTRPGPIRNYKKQWSGREHQIYTLTDVPKKKIDPNERGPLMASKFWRYLPLGIAQLVGPSVIKGTGL